MLKFVGHKLRLMRSLGWSSKPHHKRILTLHKLAVTIHVIPYMQRFSNLYLHNSLVVLDDKYDGAHPKNYDLLNDSYIITLLSKTSIFYAILT